MSFSLLAVKTWLRYERKLHSVLLPQSDTSFRKGYILGRGGDISILY